MVQGVESLQGGQYRPIADRIETATYLLAVLTCRGRAIVKDCVPGHLQGVLDVLRKANLYFCYRRELH